MTAAAPSQVVVAPAGSTQAYPASIGQTMACAVGDLLIIVGGGRSTSGTSIPLPVWLTAANHGGSTTMTNLVEHGRTSNGLNNGKAYAYSMVLVADDIESGLLDSITVGTTGFNAQQTTIFMIVPPPNGASWHATAATRLVHFTAANSSVSNENVPPDGTGNISITNSNRAIIYVSLVAFTGAQASIQVDWNDASQHEPYFNEGTTNNGGSSPVTPSHSDRFGTNTSLTQADYQEYDIADTPASVSWSSGMNNTTHAHLILGIQTTFVAQAGQAVELDSVPTAITWDKFKTPGIATEIDVGGFASTTIYAIPGRATEVDQAPTDSANLVHLKTPGRANEIDSTSVIATNIRNLNTVTEVDVAQAIAITKTCSATFTMPDPGAERYLSVVGNVRTNMPAESGWFRFTVLKGGVVAEQMPWTAVTASGATGTDYTLLCPRVGADLTFRFDAMVNSGAYFDPILQDVRLNTGAIVANIGQMFQQF